MSYLQIYYNTMFRIISYENELSHQNVRINVGFIGRKKIFIISLLHGMR